MKITIDLKEDMDLINAYYDAYPNKQIASDAEKADSFLNYLSQFILEFEINENRKKAIGIALASLPATKTKIIKEKIDK